LMWALARYFRMRPSVDRRALPADWQERVAALDTLRFGPPAPVSDWLVLLDDLSALTRGQPSVSSAVASS
jgi:hypothetical protein